MDVTTVAHIHQVGSQMVHLVREQLADGNEYLGLIEGGGICVANSFSTQAEVDAWLQKMFNRLHSEHRCGLGCIRMPGAEFLAEESELERLVALEDTRHR